MSLKKTVFVVKIKLTSFLACAALLKLNTWYSLTSVIERWQLESGQLSSIIYLYLIYTIKFVVTPLELFTAQWFVSLFIIGSCNIIDRYNKNNTIVQGVKM